MVSQVVLCPNSIRVILIGAPLWSFWKHVPNSDSAADATTFLMMDATLRIEPFRVPSFGGVFQQNENFIQQFTGIGN
jgi:hypothetical protein